MGRLDHLRQSLPLLAAQPKLRCIVVDYGCPDGSGHWVEANFPQVQVVRASAVIWFNICKARNLGARHATTPWICFMDADTLIGSDFHRDVVKTLEGRNFVLAGPCPLALSGLEAEVVELPLAERQLIFSRVRQQVLANPRAAAKIDVALPWGTDFMQPPNWQLRRTVSYCFEPIAPPSHV